MNKNSFQFGGFGVLTMAALVVLALVIATCTGSASQDDPSNVVQVAVTHGGDAVFAGIELVPQGPDASRISSAVFFTPNGQEWVAMGPFGIDRVGVSTAEVRDFDVLLWIRPAQGCGAAPVVWINGHQITLKELPLPPGADCDAMEVFAVVGLTLAEDVDATRLEVTYVPVE